MAPATTYLDIGSLQCRIRSEAPEYPEMLASWYAGELRESPRSTGPSVDLDLQFTEDPRPPRAVTDQLTVEATATGQRVITDPLTCALDLHGPTPVADFVVTDPQMDRWDLSFHLWLVTNQVLLLLDRLLLHAAAAVVGGRVAVFSGRSGAGKSTLAAALGGVGATVMSEDKVLVRPDGGRFSASGVSGRMRLTAATERHLLAGRLDGFEISTDGKHKRTFPADHAFTTDVHRDLPLDHLFLLSVGDRVEVRPATAHETVTHLLDHTQWTLRFGSATTYRRYLGLIADLSQSVPAHHLQRGPDLRDLDDLVAAVSDATKA